MIENDFMKQAANAAMENMKTQGGPFGAVIVKDNKIIATGANRVVPNNDPTAHAEIQAIRAATAKLGTFDLSGCDVYTSCEPCPMCLGAIYWAKIKNVYYANTRYDAAEIGFDDNFIYEELEKPMDKRSINFIKIDSAAATESFDIWKKAENKKEY